MCLSHLADGEEDQVEALMELDIASYIVNAMRRKKANLKDPAIRAAGSLLAGSDEVSVSLMNSGIIPALADLLNDPKQRFRNKGCWVLSNLLASSEKAIEEVFAYKSRLIIDKLLQTIQNDEAKVVFIFT